jgi:DNA processing protein
MTEKIALNCVESECWVALSLLPGFGSGAFAKWRGLTSEQQLLELESLYKRSVWKDALDIRDRCAHLGIQVIGWKEDAYPRLLQGSYAAPPVLYVQGVLAPVDEGRAVALVGTRTPSFSGKASARALVESMRGQCTSIVSGLAAGIDLASHRAALEFGLHTVAVLAQGLDLSIPGERGQVAQKILEAGGALVTPFAPGTVAHKGNFLARNGVIAGLAVATVVVESRDEGGALNTAEHCLRDERILLAVPGDILRETSQGPNMLIESGEAQAVWLPVQFPILCEMDPIPTKPGAYTCDEYLPELEDDELCQESIPQNFRGQICTLPEILERSGIALPLVLQYLSLCEIEGSVTLIHGGLYQFN